MFDHFAKFKKWFAGLSLLLKIFLMAIPSVGIPLAVDATYPLRMPAVDKGVSYSIQSPIANGGRPMSFSGSGESQIHELPISKSLVPSEVTATITY